MNKSAFFNIFKPMNILGLITARGGSKRVPRKNIKDFLGKPLLVWTIEVALKSGVLDRLVLITDDEEIARIGKQHGAEVPFMEPAELATDTSGSYGAVKYGVEWLRDNENYEIPWIIKFEPSSPGRQPFHVKEVTDLIHSGPDYDSIIGISETPGHFSHLKQQNRDKNGIITRVGDGEILRNLIHRNQDVPKSYFINSAIYAYKSSNLFDGNNSLWGDKTFGYVMDEKYCMDIDTPEEWMIAEIKMKNL